MSDHWTPGWRPPLARRRRSGWASNGADIDTAIVSERDDEHRAEEVPDAAGEGPGGEGGSQGWKTRPIQRDHPMHDADHSRARPEDRWVLWGSELSPFALKVEALLRFAGIRFRWLPAAGDFSQAFRFDRRRRRLVAGRLPLTWPQKTALDEFPLVPFLFGPAGENLYDSSA